METQTVERKAKPKPKHCMFCGKDKSAGEMSREHFVPKCLWFELPNMVVTLPAHKSCNEAGSQDDEYFRNVLISDGHVANHPHVKRIINGPLRRSRQLKELREAIALRPLFTQSGLYLGRQPIMAVDGARLERVLKKIVCGVFYKITNRLVLPTTTVNVSRGTLSPEDAEVLFENRPPHGFGLDDDVFACHYSTDRQYPDVMICQMQFYGWHSFVGRTIPADFPLN